MPPPEEPREGINPEDLRRSTLSTIRMESMSFDGTVSMLLRVVAPESLEMIDGFRADPEPNLFLASLSESRGRDSF